MTLYANVTVGGYAWARMGFNAVDPDDVKFMARAVQDKYMLWANEFLDRSQVPKTMAEVAAFLAPGEKYSDDTRIGKSVLLGTGWEGYKNLDDNDKGYQVGLAYYKAKGVRID